MPQLDRNYVFIPQRLIADLQANPVAIGVYALIARLFLIYQEPIPLSAADLQRYDPTLKYGAARGALQRLVELRWLNDQSGHKNQYTPTWGSIKGTTQPWRMGAPTLGRPAHVLTLRLDRRLLDVGLGKLIPHPIYPAQTNDRYLEQPILGLRDVGAYAQVLNGQSMAATAALWRYGLIRNGEAQPLPPTAELIALASQQTLEGQGAAPTEQGRRTLGLQPSSPPPTPGQPLFFVDHALIPDPIICSIPDLIPPLTQIESHANAGERAKLHSEHGSQPMPGTPGILSEKSDSPPNPPPRRNKSGGSSSYSASKEQPAGGAPETRAARLLQSIQAFPTCIKELAELPDELVEQAIAYAEAEPGIASVPGWVVEALRRHRDEGWPIPAPRTRQSGPVGDQRSIDIENYTCGAYDDLFRLGSDTSGLDDVPVDQQEREFVLPSTGLQEQAPAIAQAQREQCADINTALAEAVQIHECSPPALTDDALTRQIQAELRMRCGRKWSQVIEGLRIQVAGGMSLIICAASADLPIVQRELIGVLQCSLEQLGAPRRLVFTTRAGWLTRKHDDGNTRSRADDQLGV